jgi:hypothetical protein
MAPAPRKPGWRVRCASPSSATRTALQAVERHLGELGDQLAGLYTGDLKTPTAHSTAESLQRSFRGLVLSFVTVAGQTCRHLTPLSEAQHKVLRLLDYPVAIYTELAVNSVNPP